jgi:hypothetical protein
MLTISLPIQKKFLSLHSKSLLQYVGQNSATKTCQKVLRHSAPEPLLRKEAENQMLPAMMASQYHPETVNKSLLVPCSDHVHVHVRFCVSLPKCLPLALCGRKHPMTSYHVVSYQHLHYPYLQQRKTKFTHSGILLNTWSTLKQNT